MLKLKLEDIDELSKKIVQSILDDNFQPDVIIYIEKAGLLMGVSIAKILGIPLMSCSAYRALSKFKKRSTKLLNYLPEFIIRFLRKIELELGLYKKSSERHVVIEGDLYANKKYLIFDDSLDTGYTLQKVLEKMLEMGAQKKNTRIAVINVLSEEKLNPVISPDYTIYKNIHIQYPWSADSTEYKEYQRLYSEVSSN